MTPEKEAPELSIIVPAKDEEDNILPMLREVQEASKEWPWEWELIYVDDASTDATWQKILQAHEEEPRVRAVGFRRNCGQTSAVIAGVEHSRGRICVTLDGDCQNDPADIPKLVRPMGEYDMVMGWRRDRQDSPWRKIQSRIANGFRNAMTGERIHDIGCGIKAFDREKMLALPMFEGMHRFMPTLFRYKGWMVHEVEVNHRPRRRGMTKYGMWNRLFRAFRDLFAVRWMRHRMLSYQIRTEDTID